jgi:hypothetical protein
MEYKHVGVYLLSSDDSGDNNHFLIPLNLYTKIMILFDIDKILNGFLYIFSTLLINQLTIKKNHLVLLSDFNLSIILIIFYFGAKSSSLT